MLSAIKLPAACDWSGDVLKPREIIRDFPSFQKKETWAVFWKLAHTLPPNIICIQIHKTGYKQRHMDDDPYNYVFFIKRLGFEYWQMF